MSEIHLLRGSCVDQNVDVIVNAANRFLEAGGGVCGAIFSRAGYAELEGACDKYETPLNDGDAVITPAFNIKNTKAIIHSVGPNFSINPDAFDKLYLAYFNSLKLLKDNNYHSISFPLISSGIYGYGLSNPVSVSTEQCLKAYNDFTSNTDYDVDVYLCCFNENEYEEAKQLFKIK